MKIEADATSKCISLNCTTCVSTKSHFFSGLPDVALEEINRSKTTRNYERDSVVFRAGTDPVGLICVRKGVLRVEIRSNNGGTSFVRLAKAGDILGYRALFAEEPYHISAIAHEDSEICVIPKDVYRQVSTRNPNLLLKMLKHISIELREAEMKIEGITHREAASRVAEAIISLTDKYPTQKWTRKEIATWTGMTTETAIRTLSKIKSQGLIEQNGQTFKIMDRAALLDIAGS